MKKLEYILGEDLICDGFTKEIRNIRNQICDISEYLNNATHKGSIVKSTVDEIINILFSVSGLLNELRFSFGSTNKYVFEYTLSLLRLDGDNSDVLVIINSGFAENIKVAHFRSLCFKTDEVVREVVNFVKEYINNTDEVFYDIDYLDTSLELLRPIGLVEHRFPIDELQRERVVQFINKEIEEKEMWVRPHEIVEDLFLPLGLNLNMPFYFNNAINNKYVLTITIPFNECYMLAIIYDRYDNHVWVNILNEEDNLKAQICNFLYNFCENVIKVRRIAYEKWHYMTLLKGGFNTRTVVPYWTILEKEEKI